MGHSKEAIRRVCARVVGLVHRADIQVVKELMESALSAGTHVEKYQGHLLASAYVYERAAKQSDFQHPPIKLDDIGMCLESYRNWQIKFISSNCLFYI